MKYGKISLPSLPQNLQSNGMQCHAKPQEVRSPAGVPDYAQIAYMMTNARACCG